MIITHKTLPMIKKIILINLKKFLQKKQLSKDVDVDVDDESDKDARNRQLYDKAGRSKRPGRMNGAPSASVNGSTALNKEG